MKGHKFVNVNTDSLLDGTCVIIKFDEKTDTICICRDMKELKIFPYIEEDVIEI